MRDACIDGTIPILFYFHLWLAEGDSELTRTAHADPYTFFRVLLAAFGAKRGKKYKTHDWDRTWEYCNAAGGFGTRVYLSAWYLFINVHYFYEPWQDFFESRYTTKVSKNIF